MPNHKDKANALVPGNWGALRDVIRDIASDLDKLNAKVFAQPKANPDAPPPPGGGHLPKEPSKPS